MQFPSSGSVLSQSSSKGRKKRGYTLADLKAVPELKGISDEQAMEIMRSLRVFAEICFNYISRRYPEITQPIQNDL